MALFEEEEEAWFFVAAAVFEKYASRWPFLRAASARFCRSSAKNSFARSRNCRLTRMPPSSRRTHCSRRALLPPVSSKLTTYSCCVFEYTSGMKVGPETVPRMRRLLSSVSRVAESGPESTENLLGNAVPIDHRLQGDGPRQGAEDADDLRLEARQVVVGVEDARLPVQLPFYQHVEALLQEVEEKLRRQVVALRQLRDGHRARLLQVQVDLRGEGVLELLEDEAHRLAAAGRPHQLVRLRLDVAVVDVEEADQLGDGHPAAGRVEFVFDLPRQLIPGQVLLAVVGEDDVQQLHLDQPLDDVDAVPLGESG
ncbi:hypothetical protein TYRP_002898 [Tyrophagus putrescentiae]|nr:hypothetical protein TYRP_002898 [Tyrophagus putrescentiae]